MDHLDFPKSMAGARDQFTKFTNANSMASAPSVVLTPQPRPQVYWIPPPNDTFLGLILMRQFLRMQIKKGLELLLGIIEAW